ncbi:hypothetical protein CRG98_002549 [Punica granatum]|uniref:BAHD acyltransferase BIA1-like n=1 Tax=Punica granatum TaxID=22663 RepID=A0A2I0LA64_PUNGR|nr:hypothetical protein CRG98_002549 [Punica granatum]
MEIKFSPAVYIPLVLFYTGTGTGLDVVVSHRLKTSLSNTLTHFYPFAGRIRDNICIDCNDNGVEFLEARVCAGTSLADVLARPEPDVLLRFLPARIMSLEAYTGSLLQVQVSLFECGGLVIGISASHKLADAATLSTLIKSWAHSARDGPTEVAPPDLTAASVFPPTKMLTTAQPSEALKLKLRTRRYLFDAKKIAALKVKSASEVVPRPTRVEAVCALLWKCKIKALESNAGPWKPSVLAQTVNLRKRLDPAMPEDSVGNLIGFYTARVDRTSDEANLPSLVAKMRKSMDEYVRDYARKLRGPDGFSMIWTATMTGGELMKEDGFTLSVFTSWCRLGLYEADFGCGKPDWMSSCSSDFKNTSVLTDTKDGEGIEAWVTLREEDMELFEQDQELLSFASLNPRILAGCNLR